ncbi:MAG: SCO family protein [Thermoanaerobaculia bacterium]
MRKPSFALGGALALLLAGASQLGAQPMNPAATGLGQARPINAASLPNELKDVGWDQRLGESLPLDLAMKDETGRVVALGDYFGKKPVVLVPVYFNCPMLCKLVVRGMADAFADVPFTPGKEYEVVAYSFDPADGPAGAAEKKQEAIRRFGRKGSDDGWHFLTGDEAAIARLNQALGFRTRKDPKTGEYAHAAGLVVATPQGKLARYFFGFDYPAKTLRLTLVEASDEKIGSLTDHVLMFCFKYDPATGKYSALTMNAVRLAGAMTLLALVLYVGTMLRRERWRNQKSLGTA